MKVFTFEEDMFTLQKTLTTGIILVTLAGCRQSEQQMDKTYTENSIPKSDTSNQYVYDFMNIIIDQMLLDRNHGLSLEPQPNCDLSKDDGVFLKTLLIEKKKSEKDEPLSSTFFQFDKCLTSEDIESMLIQKENLKGFIWDNSRLGFNLSNEKDWYVFSIPLFAKNKNTAVMIIRDLCPGLCGTGRTVQFVKSGNAWKVIEGSQWIH